jgi:nitroreductase
VTVPRPVGPPARTGVSAAWRQAGETAGVEFAEVLSRRRMCRDFASRAVPAALVDRLLDAARRSPSAGHTQGLAFLVLDAPADVGRFWDVNMPAERRVAFAFPGLLRAPVIVVPCVSPAAYVHRYGEPDKAATGLGAAADAWTVPYWWVDGGAAVMAVLLGAADAGLGALLFGLFDRAPAVCAAFGIDDAWSPLGAVALGWPAAGAFDRPVGSAATRPRRPLPEVVRRGTW